MLFSISLAFVRTNTYFCVSVFEKLPVNTRMFKKEAYPNKVGFLFITESQSHRVSSTPIRSLQGAWSLNLPSMPRYSLRLPFPTHP